MLKTQQKKFLFRWCGISFKVDAFFGLWRKSVWIYFPFNAVIFYLNHFLTANLNRRDVLKDASVSQLNGSGITVN